MLLWYVRSIRSTPFSILQHILQRVLDRSVSRTLSGPSNSISAPPALTGRHSSPRVQGGCLVEIGARRASQDLSLGAPLGVTHGQGGPLFGGGGSSAMGIWSDPIFVGI